MDSLDFRQSPGGVTLSRHQTSYYSQPEEFLDPRLFDQNRRMRPEMRDELHGMVMGHLSSRYRNPEEWAHAWVAGSGASYQWAANRSPGDLDVLVGVDYPTFRARNPELAGLGDKEIATHINQHFQPLAQTTKNWHGYEATFYNNPGSEDIRAIKPYAAYNLGEDKWDVHPDPRPMQPNYVPQAEADKAKAVAILDRYNDARAALMRRDLSPGVRDQHSRVFSEAVRQGAALFDDIHNGRKDAFTFGTGYADPANARWQAGKENGVVFAMKALKDFLSGSEEAIETAMYGVTLPDTDTLLLRSMVATEDR